RLAWRLYEGPHLRSAALVHALCDPEREAIARLGLPPPVVVVPNGVDTPTPNPSPQGGGEAGGRPASAILPGTDATPSTSPLWGGVRGGGGLPLPADAKVLLFLGRVTPKKHIAELLRAWLRVSSAAPFWHLAVVGPVDENYRGELDGIVRRAGPA